MPTFKIQHITKYTYEVPVRDSANQIMLYPIEDDYQAITLHQIDITGTPPIAAYQDYFGNKVGTFTHPNPHDILVIHSKLEVVTRERPLPTEERTASEQWKLIEELQLTIPYLEFIRHEPFAALAALQQTLPVIEKEKTSPLEVARQYCAYVYENFTYKKGITTVDTTLDEIWKIKSGVCQDFAHILLAILKLAKLPSRYVSGYICPNKNGMRGEGATHAWVETFIPEYGWLGLDPTNNCIANDRHVRLAVGKNYYDCSPVRGTYRGTSNHTLEVAVSVEYEQGQTTQGEQFVDEPVFEKNSYRRHQEMQMQQQQQ